MTHPNFGSKWGYWRWSGLALVVALAYLMLNLGGPAIKADKFAENRPGGSGVETPLPFLAQLLRIRAPRCGTEWGRSGRPPRPEAYLALPLVQVNLRQTDYRASANSL